MLGKKTLESYVIAIYVRESRDDNEENFETIETQRDLLQDFVKKNNYGEVRKVYIDDNVSGTGFERDGLNQLKSDIRAGNVNLLVLKDLSRLGRNNAKTLLFLDFLEEYGVRVITFDGRYDSIRDNDTVGIDTWFNERYVRDISKKIRTNLRFKIQKGEYIGHAPFGYKKSTREKNKLEIDPDSATTIKNIYKMYKDGYGYAAIAAILNEKGCISPSVRNGTLNASNEWNAVAVQRILTNRVYVGDTVQGISEKISFKSKKTRRLPEEKWVITEGTHEPIISKEEFNDVQLIRSGKRVQQKPHKGLLHVFRGLLFCGNCGSILIARVRKDRPMAYICSNYGRYGKSHCSSHHINEDFFVKLIVDELKKLFCNEEIRSKVVDRLKQEQGICEVEYINIEKLEQQLAVKQRQQENLYMDKLDGKISEDLFERMNKGLEQKLSSLKREISDMKAVKKSSEDYDLLINEMLEDFDINGIRYEFARILIDKITVFEGDDDISSLSSILIDKKKMFEGNSNEVALIKFRFENPESSNDKLNQNTIKN